MNKVVLPAMMPGDDMYWASKIMRLLRINTYYYML